MPKQKLTQSLQELQDELARSDSVDEQSAAQLRQLSGDIERLLEKHEAQAEDDDGSPIEEINERINELAASFEADHPRLAATVRRVMSSLSAMGI